MRHSNDSSRSRSRHHSGQSNGRKGDVTLTPTPPDADGAAAQDEVSDELCWYCTTYESVTLLLAGDPALDPAAAWKRLYRNKQRYRERVEREMGGERALPDALTGLAKTTACGKWGKTQPSDLFLKIYHDALKSIEGDLEQAVVSPSLMGSSGTVPLTIISTVPDIIRHMSNLIVRADKEVFLATNYWQSSVSATFITNALRELSRRVGARNEAAAKAAAAAEEDSDQPGGHQNGNSSSRIAGHAHPDSHQKVVVKIMYDRGSAKQVFEPHLEVKEAEFTDAQVALPARAEIPNVDLQVVNFHQPLLGTFHSKFVVVDRRMAILQSNNVQDNANVEMAVQLEGPIVDGVYDMALVSWSRSLGASGMPMIDSPAAAAGDGAFPSWTERHRQLFGADGRLDGYDVVIDPEQMNWSRAFQGAKEADSASQVADGGGVNGNGVGDGANVEDVNGQNQQNGATLDEKTSSASSDGAAHNDPDKVDSAISSTANLNLNGDSAAPASASEGHGPQTNGSESAAQPAPPPVVVTAPTMPVDSESREKTEAAPAAASASARSFNNTDALPEHTHEDPHYDEDIAGEIRRMQASLQARPDENPLDAITRHLNHTTNADYAVPAHLVPPPHESSEQMTPYIPHPVHEPVPMALVNRPPYGRPDHKSLHNPQNDAWLSALRNARESVFIQSPTLNAEPLLPAIVDACERGVQVYCYICIGYNDAGELLPKQGGHNEMIPPKLLGAMSSDAARANLHYFWYVAKDHAAPLVQTGGRRACHIKLLVADESVGIVGSGNQDTQSWFQSQECNVLIDSPAVCRSWIDALRRNQNTGRYGRLGPDGVWRDEKGQQVEGSMGVDPGRFSWAKGVVGAVRRVQGKGGFG